ARIFGPKFENLSTDASTRGKVMRGEGGSAMPTLPVIDTDTHLSEPPDLWTSRVSSRWADQVPRPLFDERRGEDVWQVAGRRLKRVAGHAMAGWGEYAPSHPPTIEEAHPAAFDARARVQRMDEEGILA